MVAIRFGPCQLWQAKPPVDTQRPLLSSFADLANALLTTAVDAWGRSWIPNGANAAVGPVRRLVMDLPGPAKPSAFSGGFADVTRRTEITAAVAAAIFRTFAPAKRYRS